MGNKFLVLGLFLCLVLASFSEVSCQYEAVGNEGNRGLSTLDLIENEYQADVSGRIQSNLDGLDKDKDKKDQSVKKQSETQATGQKNTTSSEKTISLSFLDESEGSLNENNDKPLEAKSAQYEASGDVTPERSSMLDEFELEYQAHINGLKQANSDEVQKEQASESGVTRPKIDDFDVVKNSGEQPAINDLKQPTIDEFNKGSNYEELSATRQSMLEQFKHEFEAAATKQQKKINDVTGGTDDQELSANRQSMLDEIEREYEATAAGLEQLKVDISKSKDDEEQSAKRQSMLEEIEREYEAAASGLKQLKVDFSETKDDAEHSAKRQSMLEEIEHEYEAAANSLKQLRADFSGGKDDEEQSAKRQSMLDEIEREYEAAASGFKQLKVDFSESKDDEEQSAKRQSMLEEIEREYEAASKNPRQLRADFTESKDDEEQSAKRKTMLEEIEREYEEAAKNLKQLRVDFTESKDDEEQSAKRRNMLDEIEREYQAATKNLKQLRFDFTESKVDEEEQAAKRRSMLDEIEREFEAAVSGRDKRDKEGLAKKQGGSSTLNYFDLSQSADVCGCFNQHTLEGGLKGDKDASVVIPRTMNFDDLLEEDLSLQSETSAKTTASRASSLTTSLTRLVENHKNPKVAVSSRAVSSSEPSSSSQGGTVTKSERAEALRAKIKSLGGVSVHELVSRAEFDEILAAAIHLEGLDSASVSHISRLARYKNVIKEGIEASNRVHMAHSSMRMLGEIAEEKQDAVDADAAAAKALAQRGDALYVKIVALRKLLAKLEAEKESVDAKFEELVRRLSRLLEEGSHAQEEYKAAIRRAKDEEASQEFAREATESAERIWVMFTGSL